MSTDLIGEIREIKKKLDDIEKAIIRLVAEKEEAEIISEDKYRELIKKAEHLKKHPEEVLNLVDAIKELIE